jgi:hypothetical protein
MPNSIKALKEFSFLYERRKFPVELKLRKIQFFFPFQVKNVEARSNKSLPAIRQIKKIRQHDVFKI